MDFTQLSNKLKSIKIVDLMDKAVLANKEEILDANTSQLSKGKYADGDNMPNYSSVDYAQFKAVIGSQAPLGVTDLKLSGDFYGGFYLKVDRGGYEIGSTDSKEKKLQGIYGAEIFGLTDESKNNLNPQITETLLKDLRDGMLR